MRVTTARSRLRRRTALGAVLLGVGGSFMFASPASAVPVAPDVVATVPDKGQVQLDWTPWGAGTFAGTEVFDHYEIGYYPSGATACANITDATIVTCDVTSGLTAGTEYAFRVAAVGTIGTKAYGAVDTATPWDTPLTLTGLTFTSATATTGTLSWSAPTSAILRGGALAAAPYAVTAVGATPCGAPVGTTCAITGLVAGTPATFGVTVSTVDVATGLIAYGTSPVAALTVTLSAPGAPTSPAAIRAGSSSTVTWVAPESTGGSSITGYTVIYAVGDKTIGSTACTPTPATALTCVATGLTEDVTYSYMVKATNAIGSTSTSAFAETTAAVPDTPDAPEAASASDTSATVMWTAPGDGGSAITGYTVQYASGGVAGDEACTTTGALTCTVSGLITGTSYTFTVMATNAVGDSAASEASNEVIPGTTPVLPTAPMGVSAMPLAGSAMVHWDEVTELGSGTFSGYVACAVETGGTPICATTSVTDATETSVSIEGLTDGTTYSVTVYVTTSAGNSAESDAVVVTPGSPTPPATVPTADADLELDTTAPTAGQEVMVTGSGFAPNTAVVITIYSDPYVLDTVTSDADGNISAAVMIPSDYTGTHTIVAQGYSATGAIRTLAMDVTIAAAAPTPTPVTTPGTGTTLGTTLATTGGPVVMLLLLGLGLVSAGGVLLVSVSRRNGTNPFQFIKDKALSLAGMNAS